VWFVRISVTEAKAQLTDLVRRAEALLVARHHDVGEEMTRLIDGLGFTIVDVTPNAARRVAAAYQRWGKGSRQAGLNFGDCFAFDVAKDNACRLLFIGNDFSKTDLDPALTTDDTKT
jgi:ribonuclease VapC